MKENKLTLEDLLKKQSEIYSISNDRLHSVDDFFYYQNKFFIRFLRQKDINKDKVDELIIAFAWLLSLANRMKINLSETLHRRYPYKCPFCLNIPCDCSANFPFESKKVGRPNALKPQKMSDWQKMIDKIYPYDDESVYLNTLLISDDLHCKFRKFQKETKKKYFSQTEIACADLFVSYVRVFNHKKLNISTEYQRLFKSGCYVCRKSPCQCMYSE